MRKRKDMRLGKRVLLLSMVAVLAIGAAGCGGKKDDVITITNVSYDPTRELYERYNDMFEQYYKEQYGQDIKVIQSHGGSGSQARSVVEGKSILSSGHNVLFHPIIDALKLLLTLVYVLSFQKTQTRAFQLSPFSHFHHQAISINL